MHGRDRPGVPGVQSIQKVEGLTTSDFADDQAIRPMPQGCLDQVANGDRWNRLCAGAVDLLFAPLEAKDIRMIRLQARRVFKNPRAFMLRNQVDERLGEG